MADFPVDPRGYRIERLSFAFVASFARGHSIYFADAAGRVLVGDDRREPSDIVQLGNSGTSARLLFVSARGTIFVSGHHSPLLRSADNGKSWETSHDWAFWRMTEDEESGVLYAGNYTRRHDTRYHAAVFRSADEGKTWQVIFEDPRLDHIHTVRWDAKHRNLYLAAGDTAVRGQAYSRDGADWRWINAGPREGHTDAAIGENHVLWGSDDKLGRILRAPRNPVADGKTLLWQRFHDVWWVVAANRQIYAGTLTSQRAKGQAAFLMASADEGTTWQRLLVDEAPSADGISAFLGDSRQLTAGGWLYVATAAGGAFRLRREPASTALRAD